MWGKGIGCGMGTTSPRCSLYDRSGQSRGIVIREASRKVAEIKEILARGPGSEPEVWIIRYGLRKADYTAAEAALIDLLMTFPIVPCLSSAPRR